MGWLDSTKRAIRKVVGHRIIDEINRTGRNIAPLAQPVLTAAGAIIGGAGGATAGAQIGGLAKRALSGKSLRDDGTPEVTVTFVLVDTSGNPILDKDGNYITEENLNEVAARAGEIAAAPVETPPTTPESNTAPLQPATPERTWYTWILEALDHVFGVGPAVMPVPSGAPPRPIDPGTIAPAQVKIETRLYAAESFATAPVMEVAPNYTGTITFGGRTLAQYVPPEGTVVVPLGSGK